MIIFFIWYVQFYSCRGEQQTKKKGISRDENAKLEFGKEESKKKGTSRDENAKLEREADVKRVWKHFLNKRCPAPFVKMARSERNSFWKATGHIKHECKRTFRCIVNPDGNHPHACGKEAYWFLNPFILTKVYEQNKQPEYLEVIIDTQNTAVNAWKKHWTPVKVNNEFRQFGTFCAAGVMSNNDSTNNLKGSYLLRLGDEASNSGTKIQNQKHDHVTYHKNVTSTENLGDGTKFPPPDGFPLEKIVAFKYYLPRCMFHFRIKMEYLIQLQKEKATLNFVFVMGQEKDNHGYGESKVRAGCLDGKELTLTECTSLANDKLEGIVTRDKYPRGCIKLASNKYYYNTIEEGSIHNALTLICHQNPEEDNIDEGDLVPEIYYRVDSDIFSRRQLPKEKTRKKLHVVDKDGHYYIGVKEVFLINDDVFSNLPRMNKKLFGRNLQAEKHKFQQILDAFWDLRFYFYTNEGILWLINIILIILITICTCCLCYFHYRQKRKQAQLPKQRKSFFSMDTKNEETNRKESPPNRPSQYTESTVRRRSLSSQETIDKIRQMKEEQDAYYEKNSYSYKKNYKESIKDDDGDIWSKPTSWTFE